MRLADCLDSRVLDYIQVFAAHIFCHVNCKRRVTSIRYLYLLLLAVAASFIYEFILMWSIASCAERVLSLSLPQYLRL